MQLREIMTTDVLDVEPAETLQTAAQAMKERKASSAVVTEDGYLIGIMTERDIVKAVADGIDTEVTHVRDYMTPAPIAANPDTSVEEAAQIMLEHGFRHLPVVDGERLESHWAAIPATPLIHLLLGRESWTVACQQLDARRWALGAVGERLEVEVQDDRSRQIEALTGRGRERAVGTITGTGRVYEFQLRLVVRYELVVPGRELPLIPPTEAEARRISQPTLSVLGGESDALWSRFGETHRLLGASEVAEGPEAVAVGEGPRDGKGVLVDGPARGEDGEAARGGEGAQGGHGRREVG